jgi:hypothetical protein
VSIITHHRWECHAQVALRRQCVGLGDNGSLGGSTGPRGGLSSSVAADTIAVPPFGSVNNQLSGVAGSSSNDVWAVGDEDSGGNPGGLIEHWNGSAWAASTGSGAGSGFGGVAAITSTNAWAVGSFGLQTFVEHWNGASWSVVANPNGPGGEGYLAAVSAVSASNIWPVGANSTSALIERWNGTKWSVQSSPAITGTSFLSSVREISASEGGREPEQRRAGDALQGHGVDPRPGACR